MRDPEEHVTKERKKIIESIAMADVESEEFSDDSELQLAPESKNKGLYDNTCNEYAETEVERTNNLNNMQKIITRLLKKGNQSKGCQTDPVEGLEPLEEDEKQLEPDDNLT